MGHISQSRSGSLLAKSIGFVALALSQYTPAYELYSDTDTHVNANFLAVYGMFNSRKNYDGTNGGST